jgi:pyrophosphatase PpaX
MPGFDPVIFDLDGTVVDTVELIRETFRFTALKVLGHELPESVLLAGVGKPLMPQMQALSPDHAQELYDVYREYNHRRHDELIRTYDGIREALEALKTAGRRLGIVTSKSADTTAMAFRVVGMRELFDAVVTASDTAAHKPAPEPLWLCLELLGAPGRNTGADAGGEDASRPIFIGDSPVDIGAGEAAGLATAAVTWGLFSRADLREARPTFLLDDPVQLVDLCVRGVAPAGADGEESVGRRRTP